MADAAEERAGARVLVVDDERNIRRSLRVCLEGSGAEALEAATGAEALAAVEARPFDLCLLDLRLRDEDGIDLIPALLRRQPGLAIVVITAYAAIETAVEAIRRGARDYLPKPFSPEQVRAALDAALAARRGAARLDEVEAELRGWLPEVDLATTSPAMQRALDLALRAARSDAPILLSGESGTGKGVVARAIHARSRRAAAPFVTVHCPMLTPELVASELFGHARGAFTGAVADKPGLVEAAEGGTLFFDEVSELAPPLQAKLLRFLQERAFERVGETHARRADVRVIAATNRDLQEAVEERAFREDLLFRLNVIEVTIPPLRERPGDLRPLAERFLAFLATAEGQVPKVLDAEAARRLEAYRWPGNVRELRNAIERATIVTDGPTIGVSALPEAIRGVHVEPAPGADGPPSLADLEREHIERVVAESETLEEAARILGINVATLYRKRRRYRER